MLCSRQKRLFCRKELLDNVEDPAQLSHHLNELPPSKRSACIVALICRAIASPSKKGLLMSLSESIVLDILEETRDVRGLSFRV